MIFTSFPPCCGSGGGAERLPGPEGGGRHHRRVAQRPAAPLPADPQLHLGREELHHRVPAARRPAERIHEQEIAISPWEGRAWQK